MAAMRSETPWLLDFSVLLLGSGISGLAIWLMRLHLATMPAWLRWLGFAVLGLAGIATGLLLQREYWPLSEPPHPKWMSYLMLTTFQLFALLPEAINAETSRRARQALAAEALQHKLAQQILEARLAALQGQIEPHFLYNTLANVQALIRQDASKAESMLNHLIAYLRAAMPDLRESTTTLGQELKRAEAYLGIMQLRLGPRLAFQVDAPEAARGCLIPPLGLMTLVENAIKHGIEPLPAGGRIVITAAYDCGNLQVEVSDNGAGFQSEGGDGVGLVNLQERLQALYGEKGALTLDAGLQSGVVARISLPASTMEV